MFIIWSSHRQQHAVAMTMATAGGGGATQSTQSSFTAHTSQAAVTTGPGSSSSSSSQEGPHLEHAHLAAGKIAPPPAPPPTRLDYHVQRQSDKGPTGNAPPTISPSCTPLPVPAPSLAPLTSEGAAIGTSSLELDELLQSSSTEVSMETIQRIDVVTHHKRCVEMFSREFSVTWGGGSTHAPVLYAVDQLSKELASKSECTWFTCVYGFMFIRLCVCACVYVRLWLYIYVECVWECTCMYMYVLVRPLTVQL